MSKESKGALLMSKGAAAHEQEEQGGAAHEKGTRPCGGVLALEGK